jgi:antirestriction protein
VWVSAVSGWMRQRQGYGTFVAAQIRTAAAAGAHFVELCAQRGIPLLFLQNIMVRAVACAGRLPACDACPSAGEGAAGCECFTDNIVCFVVQACHLITRSAL